MRPLAAPASFHFEFYQADSSSAATGATML